MRALEDIKFCREIVEAGGVVVKMERFCFARMTNVGSRSGGCAQATNLLCMEPGPSEIEPGPSPEPVPTPLPGPVPPSDVADRKQWMKDWLTRIGIEKKYAEISVETHNLFPPPHLSLEQFVVEALTDKVVDDWAKLVNCEFGQKLYLQLGIQRMKALRAQN